MIHFNFIRCPECRRMLDIWFFGASTFLGPEVVECRKCRCNFTTGRSEWSRKNLKGKSLTLLICALYLALGGYAFGLSFFRMNEIYQQLPEMKDPPFEQMKFELLSGTLFVFMILTMKFIASARRDPAAVSQESPNSFSLTFGTQAKMILLLFLLYFIAGACSG